MKKSRKIIISLIVIILIAIIGLIVYKTVFNNSQEEVKIIKSIKNYDYNLKENETELYKTEFNELDKILSKKNVDYEEYAKSIAKLFIIDFYTLDNKLSKNDIGGTEFIKEDMRDNFIEEARSTFYKYVEVIDGRTQELPEVSSITDVSVEKTEFKYSDKTIDENAYKVSISWDYVEDLGYEKEASMIIVKQDKKLYIVEMD
mgnify:FL=1